MTHHYLILIDSSSFVLQKDPETGELFPLIIAGGGGGKSCRMGYNLVKADGGLSETGPGLSAITPVNGPGELVSSSLVSFLIYFRCIFE